MPIAISIQRHALSDYSMVFSVHMGAVEINAISEADAIKLADKIADAIKSHSIDDTEITGLTWRPCDCYLADPRDCTCPVLE